MYVQIQSSRNRSEIKKWVTSPNLHHTHWPHPTLTAHRESGTSSYKLDEVSLFHRVVGAQHLKQVLNSKTVVRVAVIRSATLHQLCQGRR